MSCAALCAPEKRRPSVSGALTFAALAAALLPAFLLAFDPFFGRFITLAAYLVGVTCGYALWLAPSRRSRRSGLIFNAAAGAGLIAVLPFAGVASLPALAIGCALSIAVTRSALYYRIPLYRALVLETCLTAGGLLLAQLLAGPSLLAMAASLWGFLLVQSFYGLAPGLRVRDWREGPTDPFERASGRLRALLEEA